MTDLNFGRIHSGYWTSRHTFEFMQDDITHEPMIYISKGANLANVIPVFGTNITELNSPNSANSVSRTQFGTPILKAGDHIFFSAEAKTTVPEGLAATSQRGFNVGMDVYGSSARLWEMTPRISGQDYADLGAAYWEQQDSRLATHRWVKYGNTDWEKIFIDWIVPDKIFTEDDRHTTLATPQRIIGYIAFMGCNWRDAAGSTVINNAPMHTWIRRVNLFINPTVSPFDLYPCPFNDSLTFYSQAELDEHIKAEHYNPIPPTPPPSKSIAARVPMVGNSDLVQVYLRKLRDRVFTKEQHKKLHPII